jgi:streptogramin lyase
LYVTDFNNHRIQKFDSSGTYLTQWGSYGTGNGQFKYPTGVAIDGSGNVYVAEYTNNRIQKFDSSGTYLTKWGSYGTDDGQFQLPLGVAVDGTGGVYVADNFSNRIQKFDSLGNYLTKWGSSGTGDGQFQFAFYVAVAASGNVYVSDAGNQRIQKFAPSSATTTNSVESTTTTTSVIPTTTTSALQTTTTTTINHEDYQDARITALETEIAQIKQALQSCGCTAPPTNINLSALKAIPSNEKVTLKWQTETETDNTGFNIWRAEGFQKINEEFIPALGSPVSGSEYDFVDQWVLNGKRYFYLLEDVATTGMSTFHGPVKATPRWIYGVGR